jgi:hypothetical protein
MQKGNKHFLGDVKEIEHHDLGEPTAAKLLMPRYKPSGGIKK